MIQIEINEKYRTGFMPHWGIADVTITEEFRAEIEQWLKDRNITQCIWTSFGGDVRSPSIGFENEKDAIMFKLVWN